MEKKKNLHCWHSSMWNKGKESEGSYSVKTPSQVLQILELCFYF